MYPVIALIVLMLFTWIVAIWASCDDGGEESHDEEHSEKGSEEQHHRDAA